MRPSSRARGALRCRQTRSRRGRAPDGLGDKIKPPKGRCGDGHGSILTIGHNFTLKCAHFVTGAADKQGATDFTTGNRVVIQGNSNDNSLFGTAGSDEISGLAGNDTIFGGESDDTLFGGDGDDTFFGALTYQSTIDGGNGVDTLDLSDSAVDFSASGTFVIDIDQGVSISNGASFSDGSYSNLENIISFDYVAIEMIGNAANNTLVASLYDDTIRGEDGNDVLSGRDGDDMLFGDAGNDTLTGGNGIDSLYGGAGADRLVVLGGTGSDDLYGGNGNDTGDFTAITGADMVFNSADQTYAFSAGGETFAMNSIEKILAGSGNDLIAGANAYTLTIDGGAGVDTLDLSSSYINVSTLGDYVIDIDEGFSTNGGSVFDFGDFSNLENVTSFEKVAIVLIGNGADNTLAGSIYGDIIRAESGSDTLVAGAGDDILDGGAGADSYDGGTGTDTIDWSAETAAVMADFTLGTAGIGAISETFTGVEQALFGSGNDIVTVDTFNNGAAVDYVWNGGDGIDQLILKSDGIADEVDLNINAIGFENVAGSNDDNTIQGTIANNNLQGRGGDDILTGGGGSDILSGGNGADTVYGGDDGDTIRGEADIDNLFGNGGDDDISAGTGEDLVFGGAGADTIRGQGQNDILNGDAGNDTIYGGSGADEINGGDDDDSLFGQGNNDTLNGGNGNDTLGGAAGSDELYGGAGDDVLTGGIGLDTLDGGAGNDLMNGGLHADSFVFGAGYDQDRVNGFEQGIDTLLLDASLWSGTSGITDTQDVLNAFGALNGTGTIYTLTFGSDVIELQNAGGINAATLAADLTIL
ncbi:MAG: hypothetical protein COB65_10900 [Thalassobium sp.]|nr:MAG: hypothetical protein COB65_10900 [Thalassobium sp.]